MQKLILGTVQLGIDYGINNTIGKPSVKDALAILNEARNNDIYILDTADSYGNAIEIISEFHKSNQPFEIITKFVYKDGFNINMYTEQLLHKLYIEHIHTFMFHRFHDINPILINSLKEQKAKKKIIHIGVSIYTNEELIKSIENPNIDVIQLPFNLLDNYSQRGELLKKAKEHGKSIHTRSPFLQGLFFKELNTLPVFLAPLKKYLQQLQHLAQEYKLDMQTLALNYALHCKEIDNVLFGVESMAQLQANLRTVKYEFSNELFKKINEIYVVEQELLSPVNWK